MIESDGAQIGVSSDDLLENILDETHRGDPALVLFDGPVHDLRNAQDLARRFYAMRERGRERTE